MQKKIEDQGARIQEPNMQGGNCTDPRGDGEVREVLEFTFTPDPSQEMDVRPWYMLDDDELDLSNISSKIIGVNLPTQARHDAEDEQ